MSVSYKQLAVIHDCLLKTQILKALDIQPPFTSNFYDISPTELVTYTQDCGYVHFRDGVSRLYSEDEILKAVNLSKGTALGDSFREWLRSKGWVPKAERDVAAPQENTKTII